MPQSASLPAVSGSNIMPQLPILAAPMRASIAATL
jgi:hypothetical protein